MRLIACPETLGDDARSLDDPTTAMFRGVLLAEHEWRVRVGLV
jgi:hypothetical protein